MNTRSAGLKATAGSMQRVATLQFQYSILDLQFLALEFGDFHIIGAGMRQDFVQSGFQFAMALLELRDMGIDCHIFLHC